jgi:hypothetical protein
MENRFIGNETKNLLVGIFNVMDFSREYVEYKIKEQKKSLNSDELKEIYKHLLYFYDKLLN